MPRYTVIRYCAACGKWACLSTVPADASDKAKTKGYTFRHTCKNQDEFHNSSINLPYLERILDLDSPVHQEFHRNLCNHNTVTLELDRIDPFVEMLPFWATPPDSCRMPPGGWHELLKQPRLVIKRKLKMIVYQENRPFRQIFTDMCHLKMVEEGLFDAILPDAALQWIKHAAPSRHGWEYWTGDTRTWWDSDFDRRSPLNVHCTNFNDEYLQLFITPTARGSTAEFVDLEKEVTIWADQLALNQREEVDAYFKSHGSSQLVPYRSCVCKKTYLTLHHSQDRFVHIGCPGSKADQAKAKKQRKSMPEVAQFYRTGTEDCLDLTSASGLKLYQDLFPDSGSATPLADNKMSVCGFPLLEDGEVATCRKWALTACPHRRCPMHCARSSTDGKNCTAHANAKDKSKGRAERARDASTEKVEPQENPALRRPSTKAPATINILKSGTSGGLRHSPAAYSERLTMHTNRLAELKQKASPTRVKGDMELVNKDFEVEIVVWRASGKPAKHYKAVNELQNRLVASWTSAAMQRWIPDLMEKSQEWLQWVPTSRQGGKWYATRFDGESALLKRDFLLNDSNRTFILLKPDLDSEDDFVCKDFNDEVREAYGIELSTSPAGGQSASNYATASSSSANSLTLPASDSSRVTPLKRQREVTVSSSSEHSSTCIDPELRANYTTEAYPSTPATSAASDKMPSSSTSPFSQQSVGDATPGQSNITPRTHPRAVPSSLPPLPDFASRARSPAPPARDGPLFLPPDSDDDDRQNGIVNLHESSETRFVPSEVAKPTCMPNTQPSRKKRDYPCVDGILLWQLLLLCTIPIKEGRKQVDRTLLSTARETFGLINSGDLSSAIGRIRKQYPWHTVLNGGKPHFSDFRQPADIEYANDKFRQVAALSYKSFIEGRHVQHVFPGCVED